MHISLSQLGTETETTKTDIPVSVKDNERHRQKYSSRNRNKKDTGAWFKNSGGGVCLSVHIITGNLCPIPTHSHFGPQRQRPSANRRRRRRRLVTGRRGRRRGHRRRRTLLGAGRDYQRV